MGACLPACLPACLFFFLPGFFLFFFFLSVVFFFPTRCVSHPLFFFLQETNFSAFLAACMPACRYCSWRPLPLFSAPVAPVLGAQQSCSRHCLPACCFFLSVFFLLSEIFFSFPFFFKKKKKKKKKK